MRSATLAAVAAACLLAPVPGHADVDPVPRGGCLHAADAEADNLPRSTGADRLPPDPDTDVRGITARTTAAELVFYVQVAQLGPRSAYGIGRRAQVKLSHGTDSVTVVASTYERAEVANPQQVASAASGTTEPTLGFRAGARRWRTSGVRLAHDSANRTIVVGVSRTALATEEFAPPDGATIHVRSEIGAGVPLSGSALPIASDTVDFSYSVGDNRCFGPAPTLLDALAGTTAQYGDPARLSARLTDSTAGTPVRGRRVSFRVAGRVGAGVTGSDGVARVTLAHGQVAGSYPISVSYDGDAEYRKASLAGVLVVRPETTSIAPPAVTGNGSSRSVKVTVSDDDRSPVPGIRVDLWINGRRQQSKYTDAQGKATFHAVAGQTVQAEVPAVPGRYLGYRGKATRLG